jgi:hypothetical protein
MVVMLLDHTRDFTHGLAVKFDPVDLTQTSVPLFFQLPFEWACCRWFAGVKARRGD